MIRSDRAVGVRRNRGVVVTKAWKAGQGGAGAFADQVSSGGWRGEPLAMRPFAMAATRWNFNEGAALRPQSAMAARRRKGAALLVTGERGEIDRYVRGGVVGASGDPPRNGGLITRQSRSGSGERRVRGCWKLCARFTGRRARRSPWPGDNESRPSRYQHNRQPRGGRRPPADGV